MCPTTATGLRPCHSSFREATPSWCTGARRCGSGPRQRSAPWGAPPTSKFYALKTQQPGNGPKITLVMLGPSYIDEIDESFLLPWETATVLSLEKNFSI